MTVQALDWPELNFSIRCVPEGLWIQIRQCVTVTPCPLLCEEVAIKSGLNKLNPSFEKMF